MPSGRIDEQSFRRISDAVRIVESRFTRLSGASKDGKFDTGWRNFTSSESVPANACIALGEPQFVQGIPIFEASKPNDEPGIYAVNSAADYSPSSGGGLCRYTGELEILYESSASPQFGDLYGPIPDQWYIGPDTAEPIFVVLGVVDSERKILLARMTDNIQGIGKANETIAHRSSGDISIWRGTGEEDSEQDREMFNLGPEVEEDDWVQWSVINGQFVFSKLCS